jgi:hypothetical protein
LGLVALVGLIVGVFILAGLFRARSLLWREFSAYFLSPIAYVVLVVFLAVTGYLFYLTLDQLTASGPKGVEFPMQFMLGDERFWLVFLFIPPLLTMRLFAEERSTGTLEMLMTAPVKDWQVVLCKYVACLGFYVLLWVPTLAYLPVLLDLRQAAELASGMVNVQSPDGRRPGRHGPRPVAGASAVWLIRPGDRPRAALGRGPQCGNWRLVPLSFGFSACSGPPSRN